MEILDHPAESIRRLSWLYEEYIERYESLLKKYNEITDGDEAQFVSFELDIYREIFQYSFLIDIANVFINTYFSNYIIYNNATY